MADAIRTACIQVAIERYDQAAADGLCAEGAWEVALAAMQALDLRAVVRAQLSQDHKHAGA
ncbi:MAG: acetyltransferase [Caldilineaceae bacterium]|nr:acetyltransferase [Caldilineaceae bacterium]